MIYLAAFAMSLVMVYLKASQQLHVVHLRWARVPLFSYGLASTEVVLWAGAGYLGVSGDILGIAIYILALGTGGWMGAFIGMYQHKRWADERDIERVGL